MDGSPTTGLDPAADSGEPFLPSEPEPVPASQGWPNIADYWPDGPTLRAGVGDARDRPAMGLGPPPVGLDETTPRPGWRSLALLGVVVAVLSVGGGFVILRQTAPEPASVDAAGTPTGLPTGDSPASGPTGSGPTGPTAAAVVAPQPSVSASDNPAARPAPTSQPATAAATKPLISAGTFELASKATEIHVTTTNLGADLFRISTPPRSGVEPRAALDGTLLRLTVTPSGRSGSGRVDVLLNERVSWAFRMVGGVRAADVDLRAGPVSRIDLIGGAARIDLSLPAQRAVVPVRMVGGVKTWRIHLTRRPPVRVLAQRGGGTISLFGRRTQGVAQGSVVKAAGTADGEGGLVVDAVAGLGTLTVDGT